jgi:uncharacterized membrane protein
LGWGVGGGKCGWKLLLLLVVVVVVVVVVVYMLDKAGRQAGK